MFCRSNAMRGAPLLSGKMADWGMLSPSSLQSFRHFGGMGAAVVVGVGVVVGAAVVDGAGVVEGVAVVAGAGVVEGVAVVDGAGVVEGVAVVDGTGVVEGAVVGVGGVEVGGTVAATDAGCESPTTRHMAAHAAWKAA